MVANGGFPCLLLLLLLLLLLRRGAAPVIVVDNDEEVEDPDDTPDEAAKSGANADASNEETSVSDHILVILSGKRAGSSTTKTSDSLRRPSWSALFCNSFFRMWPSPSASPEFLQPARAR